MSKYTLLSKLGVSLGYFLYDNNKGKISTRKTQYPFSHLTSSVVSVIHCNGFTHSDRDLRHNN